RRRKNRREGIYQRQNDALHHLPRTGSHGCRGYSADRGTVAELHHAAIVGHAAGDTEQGSGTADEGRSCEFDSRGHACDRRLRLIQTTCKRSSGAEANFLKSAHVSRRPTSKTFAVELTCGK